MVGLAHSRPRTEHLDLLHLPYLFITSNSDHVKRDHEDHLTHQRHDAPARPHLDGRQLAPYRNLRRFLLLHRLSSERAILQAMVTRWGVIQRLNVSKADMPPLSPCPAERTTSVEVKNGGCGPKGKCSPTACDSGPMDSLISAAGGVSDIEEREVEARDFQA